MEEVVRGNDLLTVPEMAKMLKISRSKAYALVKEKDFPIIKIGKCIRISQEKVLSWLNNY
jgi:excisionase family DNA binding protein